MKRVVIQYPARAGSFKRLLSGRANACSFYICGTRMRKTYKTIPNGELAIIPDAGHFVFNWDQQKVIPAIETFLSGPSVKIPFATMEKGYHAGETR